MLTNLSFDKLNRLLDLVQDGSLKCNILDDVHLSTNLFINTLVSDETSAGPGEELLWILAKEKNTSGAHLLFTIDLRSSLLTLGRADASIALLSLHRSLLVGPHKTIVLSQVLQGTFPIAYQLCIVGNSIHVDVIDSCPIHSRIFVIAFSFVVHQLHTLIEGQFPALIANTHKGFICLVCM